MSIQAVNWQSLFSVCFLLRFLMKPMKCKEPALAHRVFAAGFSYLQSCACPEPIHQPVLHCHCHPEVHIEPEIHKELRPVPWETIVMDEWNGRKRTMTQRHQHLICH